MGSHLSCKYRHSNDNHDIVAIHKSLTSLALMASIESFCLLSLNRSLLENSPIGADVVEMSLTVIGARPCLPACLGQVSVQNDESHSLPILPAAFFLAEEVLILLCQEMPTYT